jgi:hypothetical protein
LEFKRDFDFQQAPAVPVLKNRGFANIANAQVQHDGNVIARLIAARSAHHLGAALRAMAAPAGMASPTSRASIEEIVPPNGLVGARIFFRRREEPKRRHSASALLRENLLPSTKTVFASINTYYVS